MASRRHSEEDGWQISYRMKSARALSGLTQEKFAEKNEISLTSIKCWEMGRATPRREGVLRYVNALNKLGIEVSLDWIVEGNGPGPTYVNGTQAAKLKSTSDYMNLQIELFKKTQLSKGVNPIVAYVNDDEMVPQYKHGDVIGAFYVTTQDLPKLFSLEDIVGTPWLLMLDKKEFVPRFLVMGEHDGQLFYHSKKDPIIRSGSICGIGRICWHHHV